MCHHTHVTVQFWPTWNPNVNAIAKQGFKCYEQHLNLVLRQKWKDSIYILVRSYFLPSAVNFEIISALIECFRLMFAADHLYTISHFISMNVKLRVFARLSQTWSMSVYCHPLTPHFKCYTQYNLLVVLCYYSYWQVLVCRYLTNTRDCPQTPHCQNRLR